MQLFSRLRRLGPPAIAVIAITALSACSTVEKYTSDISTATAKVTATVTATVTAYVTRLIGLDKPGTPDPTRPAPANPPANPPAKPAARAAPAEPVAEAPQTARRTPPIVRAEPAERAPAIPRAKKVVIGLLVPLSGEDAPVGRQMLSGAQMAVFDHAGAMFELRPYDTKGTPEAAAAAARQAVADGAMLLLGPLYSESVAAVAPITRAAAINVIAFTNDRRVAGQGTYVLGHLLAPQIASVLAFARARGVKRVAALVPDGKFGARALQAIVAATRAHGVELNRVVTYAEDVKSIDSAVRELAGYDARKAALKKLRRELRGRKDAKALARIDALKNSDTVGDVAFEAVIVPSGSKSIHSIAARLPYYDIPSSKVRVLGISTWERLDLKREPALEGAWYATPASAGRQQFERRFTELFGGAPGHLASLAYDATAVAALLSGSFDGPNFSAAALTDERGFEGASGLFRFLPDGSSERSYAISEVGYDTVKLVSPSKRSLSSQPVRTGPLIRPEFN